MEAARNMAPEAAAALFSDGVTPGPDDIVIALMGMTGAGKSSFISLCSDQKPAIGHDLESCTQSVGTYPFYFPGSPRKRVFLVDTPGFDDSTRSDAEVLRELAAWLTASYSNSIVLSGIIYLHRINQPRMQGSARRNIMMFKKLCGDDALKNVILATTMWDVTAEDVGGVREKQLLDTKDFWGYMASKGSKVYRHDNTYNSAMALIRHFVKEDAKIILDIQQEMVNGSASLEGTSGGRAVEAQLIEERAKFASELQAVEADLKEALSKKDTESAELLRELRLEHKKDLDEVRLAQEKLRVTMEALHEQRYAQLQTQLAEQQKAYQSLIHAQRDLANARKDEEPSEAWAKKFAEDMRKHLLGDEHSRRPNTVASDNHEARNSPASPTPLSTPGPSSGVPLGGTAGYPKPANTVQLVLVIRDFTESQPGAIAIRRGEHVVNVEMSRGNMWRGTNMFQERGLFPWRNVQIVHHVRRAQARFSYDKQEPEDITFSKDDYIWDIDMEDTHWWVGTNEKGERGNFPNNYVFLADFT